MMIKPKHNIVQHNMEEKRREEGGFAPLATHMDD